MRITSKSFSSHGLDGLPYASLVLPADSGDLVSLERIGRLFVAVLRLRSALRLPLTLDLVQQGDVLVELSEAQEAHKLVHDWLLEVDLDTESALNKARVEDFHLLLRVKCFVVHLDGEWVFVCIVVKIDEAVVE